MRRKLLKILCLMLALCALTAFAVSGAFADDGVLFDAPDLTAQHKVGNIFEIEDIKARYGEEEYTTSSIIIFPDGLAYSNDIVYLGQVGKYTIRYSARINNKTYTKDYSFNVLAEKSLMVEEKNATSYLGYAGYYPSTYGLQVNSNASGKVFLKDPINIRSFSKLGNPLIELLAVPTSYGTKDFQALNIHLIDTADENNEVIFQFTHLGDMGSLSYARGKAPNQIFMGLENGRPSYIQAYGGNKVTHSFWGLPDKNDPADKDKEGTKIDKHNPPVLRLYYDDIEKAAYTYESTGAFAMVTDFDNPEYYGNVWDGFKSDYVKIGVSITGAVGQPKYCIRTIGGIDFTQPDNILDVADPYIAVDDYASDTNSNPIGKVGVPYKMFDLIAYDNLQIQSVKREVRYNTVNGIGGTSVTINDDYTFTPAVAGEYTLFYEVTDLYGNTSETSVVVEVRDELEDFAVQIDNTADVKKVYEIFSLKDYAITGGSGISNIEIYAKKDGSETKIPLAKEKNRIIEPGDYTVYYSAKDYLGYVSTQTYNLTVENYSTPFLVDDIFMPTAFISGFEAELPTANAKFLSGNKYVDVKPTISASLNGSNLQITNGKIKPVVGVDGGMLTLTYTYTQGSASKSYPYEVPVVNVGKQGSLKMEKYFVVSNGVEVSKNVYGITFATSTSNSTVSFVKNLSSKKFEIQFQTFNTIFDNVDFIELVLFDGIGEVSLKMYADGVAKINDTIDAVYEIATSGERYTFYLAYSEATKALMHSGNEDIAIVKTYRDGSDFTGFANETFGFKFNFGTVKNDIELRLSNVNNQKLNQLGNDSAKPQFSLDERVGGMFEKNQKLTLYPIVAWDVLGEIGSMKVSVTDSNGNFVTATNGVRLEDADASVLYTFVGKDSSYTVSYAIADTNNPNNKATEIRRYTCTTAAQFKLSHRFNLPSTAKVGDTIELPQVISNNYEAFYYVIDDNGDFHMEEVSYTFRKAGTYIIRLFAFNSDYVMSYVDHKIIVE